MERVFRFIILLFVFFGVLSLANTSLHRFGRDIRFKDPFEVLNIQRPERKEQTKQPQPEKKQETKKVEENKKVEEKKKDCKSDSNKVTKKDVDKLISTIPVAKKKKYDAKKLNWGKVKLPEKKKKDPYTNRKLSSSSKVDFIIPLSYINRYSKISARDKKELINSGDNVVLTLNKNIELKSYQPPSKWLPDENKEDYCYTYLQIASKWQISMTKEDIRTCRLEINNAIDSGRKIKLLTNIEGKT